MTRFVPREDVLSWGRVLRARHHVRRPAWRDELPSTIAAAISAGRKLLPVGLRRSYGDSALNPDGMLIDMTGLDRILAFDPARRLLRAEPGVSFDVLLNMLVPHGLFLPVVPGTRFVTLAGAVANDIHGKNHHGAGTFGRWIRRIGLLRSDGDELELEAGEQSGLFAATVGGLGLTGLITWVELELASIASTTMQAENIPFGGLDEFFAIAAESEEKFDHTVAWVDCLAKGAALGRGIFMRARHSPVGPLTATGGRPRLSLPLDFPGAVLNNATVRAFNALYYWTGTRTPRASNVHYQRFFFPLDAIGQWNRIYGRRGMYQYQSVVPPAAARDATRAMLHAIASAGEGAFLAVLKTFGDKASPGMLSFPRPGTTLALDLPNRGTSTLALMGKLDAIVQDAGGRLYPAKDGRIPADMFRAGYPDRSGFATHVDPAFSSSFWKRVGA
ncbi:MAG: FAD-dependent oxidoreductase [Xanthobacteraceae bacterium]